MEEDNPEIDPEKIKEEARNPKLTLNDMREEKQELDLGEQSYDPNLIFANIKATRLKREAPTEQENDVRDISNSINDIEPTGRRNRLWPLVAVITAMLILVFMPQIISAVGGFFPMEVSFVLYDSQNENLSAAWYIEDQVAAQNTIYIKRGTYDVLLEAEQVPISRIFIKGLEIRESVISVGIGDIEQEFHFRDHNVEKAYSIDASYIRFEKAHVEGIAMATQLYKCSSWNFTEAICPDNRWVRVRNLTIGEAYNITITSGDPAFIEVDAADIERLANPLSIKSSRKIIAQVDIFNRADGSLENSSALRPGIYDAEILINDSKIERIQFDRLSISEEDAAILIDKVNPATIEDPAFVAVFAIDPSQLNFTIANLTLTAVGYNLFKCADWDYEEASCRGDWEKIMDLVPGEKYSLIIDAEDPGYGEGNAAGDIWTNAAVAYINTTIDINGSGFAANRVIEINIMNSSDNAVEGFPANVTADANGNFSTSWSVPFTQRFGSYTIDAFDLISPAYNDSLIITVKDGAAPGTVSNLTNASGTQNSIYWTWVNPSDNDFSHSIVYINGFWQANTTNGYFNSTLLTANLTYTISVKTADTSGNINGSPQNNTARTAAAPESKAPNVTLSSPANDSVSLSGNLTFEYTPVDNAAMSSCKLYLNGSLNQTDTSISNHTLQNFTVKDLSSGTYQWYVQCIDENSNTGNSLTRYVEVNPSIYDLTLVMNVTFTSIMDNVTYLISELHKTNRDLYQLLADWNRSTASQINAQVDEAAGHLDNLSSWLLTFNTTESDRHNDSRSVVSTILTWLGLADKTEEQRHNETLNRIRSVSTRIEKAKNLTSKVKSSPTSKSVTAHSLTDDLIAQNQRVAEEFGALVGSSKLYLEKGLNFITLHKAPSSTDIADVLANSSVIRVDRYYASSKTWKVYNPNAPFGNTLFTMSKGNQYWITTNQSVVFHIR